MTGHKSADKIKKDEDDDYMTNKLAFLSFKAFYFPKLM